MLKLLCKQTNKEQKYKGKINFTNSNGKVTNKKKISTTFGVAKDKLNSLKITYTMYI